MIGYIEGRIRTVTENELLVITDSGVGYTISVTASCGRQFSKGESCSLFIQTIVREDDISLYGFDTTAEKELFNLFCRQVNKVGPRLALSILSVAPVSHIISAVATSDTPFFTAISGIGKKTAEKIILELRDKVDRPELATTPFSDTPPTAASAIPAGTEAQEALAALGYNPAQIRHVTGKIKNIGKKNTEEIVREALRIISSGTA